MALCGCFFNINTPGPSHKREPEKKSLHIHALFYYSPFFSPLYFFPRRKWFFYISTDAFLQCLIAGPFSLFLYPVTEINARPADTFNLNKFLFFFRERELHGTQFFNFFFFCHALRIMYRHGHLHIASLSYLFLVCFFFCFEGKTKTNRQKNNSPIFSFGALVWWSAINI